MRQTWHTARFLLLFVCIATACERDTNLRIEGGNPPVFILSGSGSLRSIRVRGPQKQRDIAGPDASAYWYIKSEKDGALDVGEVGKLTYGVVPDGYIQVFPERDSAPPLVEGEVYFIQVSTANANGTQKYFYLKNGKAIEKPDQ